MLLASKSARMNPFSSSGLSFSSMVRCSGGVAPTPRKADGQSRSPVPSGPDKTVTMGLLLKSSVPLRSMRPSQIARRSPRRASGPFGMGVKVAAEKEGYAARQGGPCAHQPVMLLQPAFLPVGLDLLD